MCEIVRGAYWKHVMILSLSLLHTQFFLVPIYTSKEKSKSEIILLHGFSFVAMLVLRYHWTTKHSSYRVLNSWKSLQICPAIFDTWKIEIKSWKMVNSLEFFWKLQQVLYTEFFFVFIMKKALFLHFLKISTDHLFDDLESGFIIVLGKVWKQSWMLDLKICTNPVKIMY